MGEKYYRSAFKSWMSVQKENGEDFCPSDKIDAYVNALKYLTSKLQFVKIKNTDLFSCGTTKDFDAIHSIILSAPNYYLVDKQSDGYYSGALTFYRRFLDEIAKPARWIFTCNPKCYNIVPAVQKLTNITWQIDQNEKQIKKSDKVYLWMPGEDGGIIASGTVLCNPEEKEPQKNDPYVIKGAPFPERFTGVDIRLDQRFIHPFVSRSLLLADEQAKTLKVLSFPEATNDLIPPELEDVIERIIVQEYVPGSGNPDALTAKGMAGSSDPSKVPEIVRRKFWIYAPAESSRLWDQFYARGYFAMGLDALGDLKQYVSKDAIKQSMKTTFGAEYSYKTIGQAAWQFANEVNIGDIIYVGSGHGEILGRGIVKSDYFFDGTRKEYRNVRSVIWTHKGEWTSDTRIALKTLTDVTSYTGYCRELEKLILGSLDIETGGDALTSAFPAYTKDDFLRDVYMNEQKYNSLRNLLLSKKNVILAGAPGVGKTYLAERLAFSIMGEKDTDRVKMIQFHPGFRYEDFVMGYRQTAAGAELTTGIFYDFCKEAASDDKEYFFIIDDISHGDIGAIFGDLLMLIENGRRGKELRLLYRDEQFFVPENVCIIATLNTAERSPAMKDLYLRRRFSYFEMSPAFESDGFKKTQAGLSNKKFDKLVKAVTDMNKAISQEPSLGDGFLIGHSYFCISEPVDDEKLNALAEYELLPLVREYWSEKPDQLKLWTQRISAALNG